jgi:hypothetical protein
MVRVMPFFEIPLIKNYVDSEVQLYEMNTFGAVSVIASPCTGKPRVAHTPICRGVRPPDGNHDIEIVAIYA